MVEYGFTVGKDYCTILCNGEGFGKAAVRTDHAVKLDMAKEIAMLQRSEIGKQCREYFIEAEKRYREQTTVPALDSRLLYQIAQTLEEKERIIAELTPKAEFFDAVTDSTDAIDIGSAAKVLNMGIGRNKLFAFLRYKGVLMPTNQPYQMYIDAGYFRVIEQKYTKPDSSVHINIKTVVYQKGLEYIRRLYTSDKGGFAMVEAT